MDNNLLNQVKVDALYAGYLKRQENDIKAFQKDEKIRIPKDIDFKPGELLGCVSGELGLRKFLEENGHELVVTSDKDGDGCTADKELVDADVVISQPFWPYYLTREKIESINDILSSQDNTLKNEALSALVVLGIERKKANKAIDEILSKWLLISSTKGVSFLRSLPDLSPRNTFNSEFTIDIISFFQIYSKITNKYW